MKTCPACNEKENDDDERFCITCGLDLDKSQSGNSQVSHNLKPKNTEIKNSSDDKIQGRLVISDNHILPIDNSQRLKIVAMIKETGFLSLPFEAFSIKEGLVPSLSISLASLQDVLNTLDVKNPRLSLMTIGVLLIC